MPSLTLSSSYGYYINAKKSILLVKPECLDRAREIFQDSSIDFRSDGCRHLGAVLGSPTFCSAYRKIPLISPGRILCRASKTGRIFGHGLILGHGRYFGRNLQKINLSATH